MQKETAAGKPRTKLYTGVGDAGYTGLLGRDRVPKYDIRPEAYGTVDEASAALGLARATVGDPHTAEVILGIQRDLYAMMADLATLPEATTRPPWLHAQSTECLEALIARLESTVDLPPAFIVSGDSVAGAQGPMQFMPATWARWGNGDVQDPHHAIYGAARYLAASGAADGRLTDALFAYNNDNRYVRAVNLYAGLLRRTPLLFRAFYHWQVYYRSAAGDLLLPEGYPTVPAAPRP